MAEARGIWDRLSEAQGMVAPVGHDAANSFHKYTYASAEAIIAEGQRVLAAVGLAAFVEQGEIRAWPASPNVFVGDDGIERAEVLPPVYCFTLALATGSEICHRIQHQMPFWEEKGRPWDKALASARTSGLAYALRDLLLIPRPGSVDDDMSARDDTSHAPRARSRAKAVPPRREPERKSTAQKPAAPSAEVGDLMESQKASADDAAKHEATVAMMKADGWHEEKGGRSKPHAVRGRALKAHLGDINAETLDDALRLIRMGWTAAAAEMGVEP